MGSRERATDSVKERRLIVKGSVIFGYGLEPQPVGLFVLTEKSEEDSDYEEDVDDDDDDAIISDSSNEENDDFTDWSNAFQ